VEEAGEAKSFCDEIETSSEKASSIKRRRRRANRPCKGKIIRYIRFLMRACKQVEEDPASFNISDVTLPPSLIANPRKHEFFQAQIHWYQQQLLAGEKPSRIPKDEHELGLACLCETYEGFELGEDHEG